jgi:hypothetical protein
MYIVIGIAVATLALFEGIAHTGHGVDAPGATSTATTAPAPTLQAPGQP